MLRNHMRLLRFVCSFCSGLLLARAQSNGYWHTSQDEILDANNHPVRIAGVNWYGFSTTLEVLLGLSQQDYHTILNTIKNLGYNVIRLDFSNHMIETPIVPYHLVTTGINTDLRGLNSLQILDKIVAAAGQIGLRIILDNHRSDPGSGPEENGLWYTAAYPESAWINDWTSLATRYLNNPTVVGMDLRNEPHYLNPGGACWDCGGTTDWHLAAARAGNAILAVNPALLIFVEGTNYYNGNYDWWGGMLQGVANSPVLLNVTNQLVYSAHDYGPLDYAQGWFNASTTYASLAAFWTQNWGFISLNHTAPVWLGEFGTDNVLSDLQSSTHGSQGQWFHSLITFLQNNPHLNWSYWALDGEDQLALLDFNYDATPVSSVKQQMLASIQQTAQTITFAPLADTTLAASPLTLTASADSGLTVSFTSNTLSTCMVSGTSLTLVALGPCSITASQIGNSNYAAATPVTRMFNIAAVAAPILTSPANGTAGVSLTPSLNWNSSNGATSYDVSFGISSPPPFAVNTAQTTYNPQQLGLGKVYYWQVAAKNNAGSNASTIWSFTTRTACDITGEGVVNVSDVQVEINGALGIGTAGIDLTHDGIVNIVDVQFMINVALGAACPA